MMDVNGWTTQQPHRRREKRQRQKVTWITLSFHLLDDLPSSLFASHTRDDMHPHIVATSFSRLPASGRNMPSFFLYVTEVVIIALQGRQRQLERKSRRKLSVCAQAKKSTDGTRHIAGCVNVLRRRRLQCCARYHRTRCLDNLTP